MSILLRLAGVLLLSAATLGVRAQSISLSAESWWLSGKEEFDDAFGLPQSDFGARFYDRTSWTTIDPLAEKYYNVSRTISTILIMATTNFYFSEDEYLKLLKYILSKNCYFVSDIERDSPDFITIKSYEHLLQYWDWLKHNPSPGSPRLYILNDSYVECPLLQSSIIKGNRRVYFVYQRFGGPSIDLSYFPLVGKGFLQHYPYYYYEHVEYNKVPVPIELIEIFKDISKYIRKHSIRIKYYNRICYCGLEYVKMVHSASIEVEEELKDIILSC